MAFNVKVVGTVELDRKLQDMARRVGGEATDRALEKGGQVFERLAKQNITAQGLIDTGNLKASISTAHAGVGVVLVGPDQSSEKYAAVHEFGGGPPVTAKMRGWAWYQFKKTDDPMYKAIALTKQPRIKIPARPYMRPAFDEGQADAIRVIGDELRRAIEAVA